MSKTMPVVIDEEGLPTETQEHLPANPVEMLATAVVRGTLDVESMKALMDLEKEYRKEQAKAEFDAAMAKFAGLKEVIEHNQDGQGPGGSTFRYADYPQTVKAITPWLKKSGLSFRHRQDPPVIGDNGRVTLVMVHCEVRSKSGHMEVSSFPAIPDERLRGKLSDNQLLQQSLTYAKRQSLKDALGLATRDDGEDDDSAPQPAQKAQATGKGNTANESMVRTMAKACANKGLDESMVCQQVCGVKKFVDVPIARVNEVLETIRAQG